MEDEEENLPSLNEDKFKKETEKELRAKKGKIDANKWKYQQYHPLDENLIFMQNQKSLCKELSDFSIC